VRWRKIGRDPRNEGERENALFDVMMSSSISQLPHENFGVGKDEGTEKDADIRVHVYLCKACHM